MTLMIWLLVILIASVVIHDIMKHYDKFVDNELIRFVPSPPDPTESKPKQVVTLRLLVRKKEDTKAPETAFRAGPPPQPKPVEALKPPPVVEDWWKKADIPSKRPTPMNKPGPGPVPAAKPDPIWEGVEAALRGLGHPAADAKAKVKALQASGQTFATIPEAVAAAYSKPQPEKKPPF
jgi:hypothetical protein